MLHLVDKERFESCCLGKEPIQRIDGKLDRNIKWPYFEIPEDSVYVLYLYELEVFLVFGKSSISESKVMEGITFDDWKLLKISDKPDSRYILNLMKKCSYLSENFNCEAGSWKLENTRTNKIIEFSVKISGNYFKSSYIGYPEKLRIPINESEIIVIDKLIDTVYNGIRKDNN